MSSLLIFIKLVSIVYHVKKINDQTLIKEIIDLYKSIISDSNTLFGNDKIIEKKLKNVIDWMFEQPSDEPIIKSMLLPMLVDATKEDKDIYNSLVVALEDYPNEERARQLVYRNINEIRKGLKSNEFEKSFKKVMKDIYYTDASKISKEEWNKVLEIIENRQRDLIDDQVGVEVIEEVNSSDINSLIRILERAQIESSNEGVLRTGLQGINNALYPDCGFRRSKYYIFYALTNRGKSLTLSHMCASIGLYNKPLLRDKAKIPTIVLDSAEDSLDIILERMYKIIMVNKTGDFQDISQVSAEYIATMIISAFKENGWHLVINRIDPTEDTYVKACDRIRKLEMKGHEVITWFYDYVDLMSLNGIQGDTRSDKLQGLHKRMRTFIVNKGISFITCGQLSPAAKNNYQGQYGDEEEIGFARSVAGKSMTEGSTKITNEVDCEITIHVAKLGSGNNYLTYCLGKMRGEGANKEDSYGFYPLDSKLGLMHDISGKNMSRKSLKQNISQEGVVSEDTDDILL